MKPRTHIFPRVIKKFKVNVYKSRRSPIGVHYGLIRPVDDPIFRRRKSSALYCIVVTLK